MGDLVRQAVHSHEWVWVDVALGWFGCRECPEVCEPCSVCERPTGSSRVICDKCLDRERAVLDAIEAHLTAAPLDAGSRTVIQAVAYDVSSSTSTDPSRLPFGMDAEVDDWDLVEGGINTADGVLEWVSDRVVMWRERIPVPSPLMGFDFLRAHLVWAVSYPAQSLWEEYRGEVRVVRRRAARLDPTLPVPVGPHCPDCGGRLVWKWSKDGLEDLPRCEVCLLEFTDRSFAKSARSRLPRLPRRNPEMLVTQAEAIMIFPALGSGALWKWVQRDRDRERRARETGHVYARLLPPRGRRRGRSLYRLGDIAALVVGSSVGARLMDEDVLPEIRAGR